MRTDKVYSLVVSSYLMITAMSLALAQVPPADQQPTREINQVIDLVVAEVDKRIITLSELLAETRLVLLRQGGPASARGATIGKPLLMAVLRSIVARNLLLGEARRLNLSVLPAEDTRNALRDIRRLFANRGEYVRFLERFGFSIGAEALSSASAPVPALLAQIIHDELEVERFVALRIDSSLVVSQDDIRECYLDQIDVFGGQALKLVQGRIEESLREYRAERRLLRLVTQLQQKTRIRFTSNFKSEGPLLDVSRARDEVELQCPEMR
jgi:hypothetical protein